VFDRIVRTGFPESDVTLSRLQRAAALLGRRVRPELVWLDAC
jgi:hypothetical protein